MSAKDSHADKDQVALPTPEYDIIGVSDLSQFSEGDTVVLDDHETPLTVTQVGVRDQQLATGDTTRQYAIAAKHDRENAVEHEIIEQINVADGTTMGLVDERGCPVRLFTPEVDNGDD
jgi:hypothetical protein